MTNNETWTGHDNWLAAGQYIARANGLELDPSTTISLSGSISERHLSQAKTLFSEASIDHPALLLTFIQKMFIRNPGHSTTFVAEAIFTSTSVFEPGQHPDPGILRKLLQGCASLDKTYWEVYQNVLPDVSTDKVKGLIDNLNKLLGSLSAKPSSGEGSGRLAK